MANQLRVPRLKTLAVMLLLAFWVPATSHELLEEAGLIHQETAGSGHHDDHDAADGMCVNAVGHVRVPTAGLVICFALLPEIQFSFASALVTDGSVSAARGPSPPPELSQSWHFSFRVSLPARAPSFLA